MFHDLAGGAARVRTHLRSSTTPSGREIDAVRAGLVQETHPDNALLDEALSLAAEITGSPPLAVEVGKTFINRGTADGFNESVEATALLFGTDEHGRAVDAFRNARNRD